MPVPHCFLANSSVLLNLGQVPQDSWNAYNFLPLLFDFKEVRSNRELETESVYL